MEQYIMSMTRERDFDCLLTSLIAIGEKYPKSTGGFLGMFTHHNQPVAKRLIALEKYRGKAEQIDTQFRQELEEIYNMFTQSRSFLAKVHGYVVDSDLFKDVNEKHNNFEEQIAYCNANNDGGGAGAEWTVEKYQNTIVSLNKKVVTYIKRNPGDIEMECLDAGTNRSYTSV